MTAKPEALDCTWRDRKLLTLLATGTMIVMTGAVVAPILPDLVRVLELSQVLAGYVASAHFLTVAIFSPVLGILADRTGQVRVLIISLLLYALFGMAGGWQDAFIPLLTTRVLVGAASGGIAAASLGLLVKMYATEAARSQAIAYVASALTLANVVYPVMAGLLGSLNWRWAFGMYGLGIPLAILVACTIRQRDFDAPNSAQSKSAGSSDLKVLQTVVRNPMVLQLYGTKCLTAATAYATIIYLPLYLRQTIDADTALIGIMLASQAIGAALVSAFGVRKLVRRFGLPGATVIGFGCLALMLFAIPKLQTLSLLLPVVIIFGVGLGIVMPNLYNLVSNRAPEGFQSSVLAVGVGSNFLGQFLSPSIFGIVVAHYGLSGVFYVAAVLVLVLGALLMTTHRTHLSPS